MTVAAILNKTTFNVNEFIRWIYCKLSANYLDTCRSSPYTHAQLKCLFNPGKQGENYFACFSLWCAIENDIGFSSYEKGHIDRRKKSTPENRNESAPANG